ncbi:unnamed protein product [Parnassius apollo]|uniref:(apollo) hypothetical protein n=1 Tax=Parnassius apollo TaxID=110799 RepID=A0A8S3W4C0_PARAO|nr:unnamed protein product [Parnassius apollo]
MDDEILAPHISKSSNRKIIALEKTLQQSIINFKDLVLEFENIYIESECYKSQILEQKQKCENKTCTSSEAFKQTIAKKDNIIQSIGAILMKLNETKNFSIVSDALQIISGDQLLLTPPTSNDMPKKESPNYLKGDQENLLANFSHRDTSVSEIECTPSGRKSPIIYSKKLKNSAVTTESCMLQEKKKLPDSWPSPESKIVKLIFPPSKCKSSGRLRQSRLNLVKVKTTTVVDLTSSPEVLGGFENFTCNSNLQNIKKEFTENEDMILPSPTSGPINLSAAFKKGLKDSPSKLGNSSSAHKFKSKTESKCVKNENNNSVKEDIEVIEVKDSVNVLKEYNRCKNSPSKLKKPLSMNKLKTEISSTFVDENNENVPHGKNEAKDIEESMDILLHFPNRLPSSPTKQEHSTPVKSKIQNSEDVNESMSLLQRINKFDKLQPEEKTDPCSPSKRPLLENIMPSQSQSSMSVLQTNFNAKVTTSCENVKRTKPDVIDPIFKEPTVRKKSEKQALPGWSCDQCEQFYAELYKDDPEMLRQKMDECSRHRGRRDPARARTPPGFWQPRWHVPVDTDEFNRLNDAL